MNETKNKKISIIIIIAVSLILCSCNVAKENVDKAIQESAEIKQTDIPEKVVGYASSSLTFDDAILESYLIVKGTLFNSQNNIVQDADGNEVIIGDICEFDNLEVIKGDYDKQTIKVRITQSLLGKQHELFIEGKEYFLFLSRTNIVYHGEERFHLYGYSICVNENESLDIYYFNSMVDLKISDSKKLVSYIDDLLEKNSNREIEVFNLDSDYCTSEKISDIADSSDIVLEVETTKIFTENENMVTIECEVVDSYKGDVDNKINIIFFENNYEINKRYLVLLSDFSTNNYFLSSKNSCIPVSDTEKYKEYMQYIDK